MHGRLKIKTTAEQAAEKEKEREEKRKVYLGGLNKVFSKRSSETYDEEGLKITAQLLTANPDAATLWNFRREILLNMKGEDEEAWTKLLMGELTMVEHCLMKNPKSYGAWHHRCWTMKTFPTPPWAAELDLCNKYLKLDERNFHCWDYRRFITAGSEKRPEDELKISKELIERNMSNYSAWHYRSKLLPLVCPPLPNTPHPVPVDVLIKELKTVVEAVFTDPSDQSPWFFLRWLINREEKSPRLLKIGLIENEKNNFVCTYSQKVCQGYAPTITVNDEEQMNLLWFSPNGETYSNVWATKLVLPANESTKIEILRNSSDRKTIIIPAGATHLVEWVTGLEVGGEELSDLTRSTLEEVKENCVTLDELDPDNKWVLLTLVDILWALDARNYLEKIKQYLAQLQSLDPLRSSYYSDMKSKLAMETTIAHERGAAESGVVFKLSESNLTRITSSHLLACYTMVDLSSNRLTSIKPLSNLLACKELILNNNNIYDLSALSGLSALEKLHLANNWLCCQDQLKCLQGLTALVYLDISSNPVCEVAGTEAALSEILPSVQTLKVT
ncbi:hypothetical protein SK128_010526 [Halocaridina rubra]|uniref:Geranylgeranyl transferase type-2 subunit alpha n=1 Tax=Halocaridina rubra TaxID=373956 RepID=A0AAN9FTZ5_HALRR